MIVELRVTGAPGGTVARRAAPCGVRGLAVASACGWCCAGSGAGLAALVSPGAPRWWIGGCGPRRALRDPRLPEPAVTAARARDKCPGTRRTGPERPVSGVCVRARTRVRGGAR